MQIVVEYSSGPRVYKKNAQNSTKKGYLLKKELKQVKVHTQKSAKRVRNKLSFGKKNVTPRQPMRRTLGSLLRSRKVFL